MARSRLHVAAVLLTLTVAAGCSNDEPAPPPPAPECVSALDCPATGNPCLSPTCSAGGCGTAPVAAGTLVDDAATGDCSRSVCDGEGRVTAEVDDTDLPVDGNACTLDRCVGGAPSNPAEEARAACAQDGGALCDGAGACVQCLVAADCPGSDTECSTRTCTAGVCGVLLAPLGTPLAAQTAGDCRQAACDGFGGTTTVALDEDVPVDGNACTDDRCAGGVASNPPSEAGAACTGPGGAVTCDGAGTCVQCVTAATCPGETTECRHPTCVGGACGTGFAPYGTPLAAQTAGDCLQTVCDGVGGSENAAAATDVPVDGNACTQDSCAGGTPSDPFSTAGTACTQSGGAVCDGAGACVACNVGADCASGVCADHACQAPTCTDLVRNGVETDVDCGGMECGKCGVDLRCIIDGDCTTGICHDTLFLCQNPSCTDGAKNGSETDVDCGGTCSADCARGKACLVATDCQSANCQGGLCGGPLVTGSVPADGARNVVSQAGFTLYFAKQVLSSSVTVQANDGPCGGSVQLSRDGFATCLGIASKSVASDGSWAAFQPAARLAPGTTYRVRTAEWLAPYWSPLGAFEPFETPVGFTAVDGGPCGGALVVSQIYPGGGLDGAPYASDFIELHNNGPTPISLDGLSVQYASATYYQWAATLLTGTILPGGYYLVKQAGGAQGAPLPSADAVGTLALSPLGGKVALASTRAPLTATCPNVGAEANRVLDLVGYGTDGTNPVTCFERGPNLQLGPAPAPADSGAALVRAGQGCGDGNGNALDLASQLVVPRSAASPPYACGCNGIAVNGTGFTAEMDACSVASPASLTVGAGVQAGPVYGRVEEAGITELPGLPMLAAELGFGPAATDPRYAAGWTFVPATWSAQGLIHDEFEAFFTAPAAGGWVYVYRFSPDGLRWTYCDPNGAGASPAAPFEPNLLPPLTVGP